MRSVLPEEEFSECWRAAKKRTQEIPLIVKEDVDGVLGNKKKKADPERRNHYGDRQKGADWLFSACLQERAGWLFGAWPQEPFCNEMPVFRKTMVELWETSWERGRDCTDGRC